MIKYNFFSNKGGVSTEKYFSLNTHNKSLDNPKNIAKNFEIIANHFNLETKNIALQNQGFSNIANYIKKASLYETTGDGLVTDQPNIIISIRTADCAPILFYDKENKVIGGAHTGWRSALAGVIENTLDLMIDKGAKKENIYAIVGPALQKQSFEAGEDMKQEFINKNPDFAKYFEAKNKKYLFNIKDFISDKIKKYEIKNLKYQDIDTYTNEDYFSYRKSCHKNEVSKTGDFPTQLSCIVL